MLAPRVSAIPGVSNFSQSIQTSAKRGGAVPFPSNCGPAGRKFFHQMRPPRRFMEQRAAGFRYDKRPREPQVQRPSGDGNVVLDRVACEQLGFKPAMEDNAGFSGAGFTQNKYRRQIAKRRRAGSQSAQTHPGFSHRDVDLIAPRGPFFRDLRCTVFIESSEPPHGGNESRPSRSGTSAPRRIQRSFPCRFNQGPASQASAHHTTRAMATIQYFQVVFTATS